MKQEEPKKIPMKLPIIGNQEIPPDKLMQIFSELFARVSQCEQSIVNIWNMLTTVAKEEKSSFSALDTRENQ